MNPTFLVIFVLFFAAVNCYYDDDDWYDRPYHHPYHRPHYYAGVIATGGKTNKQFDYNRRSRYRPPPPPPPPPPLMDGDDEEESLHYKSGDEFGYYESHGGAGDSPSRRALRSFSGVGHHRRRAPGVRGLHHHRRRRDHRRNPY